MASYNRVILLGNLTRDPELRVTPQGLSICKMGLAVNRSYRGNDGEMQEETTFVDVDVFGKQAEVIGKYMAKGKPILVEGRLRTDSWTTKEGDKRSKLVVVLEGFQFVGPSGNGGRGEEGGGDYPRASGSTSEGRGRSQGGGAQGSYGAKDVDEDVPF